MFINKQKPMPSTVDEIKELWPFLFFTDYLLQHFQELMGFELHVVFMETVERKAKVIFDYMKQELSRKRVKDSVKPESREWNPESREWNPESRG
jgi:hypothetical protein